MSVYQLKSGKWVAQVRIDSKCKHLGVFSTRDEAEMAKRSIWERPMTRLEWIEAHINYAKSECLFWPFTLSGWYSSIIWNGKWTKAHRVMCALSHGNPTEAQPIVRHLCGNNECLNPNHLKWGTHKENSADSISHGTMRFGSSHGRSVLTEESVLMAKEDRKSGMSYKAIGEKYGVAKGAIWHAINGSQWRHVK